jgi:hypothetical protein
MSVTETNRFVIFVEMYFEELSIDKYTLVANEELF